MLLHIYAPIDGDNLELGVVDVRSFACGRGEPLLLGASLDGFPGAEVQWTTDDGALCVVRRGIGGDRGDDLHINSDRYTIHGFDCTKYRLYLSDAPGAKRGA